MLLFYVDFMYDCDQFKNNFYLMYNTLFADLYYDFLLVL